MDFSKYNNINEKVKKFGGVKRVVLNKDLLEEAEKSWEQFTPEEISLIDEEFPTALQVFLPKKIYGAMLSGSICTSIITSKAICIYNRYTFTAIPVKDILWIYPDIFTQKMNFIPYNKTHSLILLARNGKRYTLGSVSTGGFSRKKPASEELEKIRNVLDKYRKGIIYGYTDEINNMFALNFGKAIEMVDANSEENIGDN